MFLCRRSLVRPQAVLHASSNVLLRRQSYATTTSLPKLKKKLKREKLLLERTGEVLEKLSKMVPVEEQKEPQTESPIDSDSQDYIATLMEPPKPKRRPTREKLSAKKPKTKPTPRPKKLLKRGKKVEVKEESTDSNYPIAYTRRVEGLIEHSNKPVLTDIQPIIKQRPVAKLSHGLDRVLFNPGVHWLQDPRSRVYNYTPWLENIPKVSDFAFERLSGFVKSSHDEEIWQLLKREDRTFAGSTSSLTGILGQIYFLISGDKTVNTQTLSHNFLHEPRHFTPGQRMPTSVIFNCRDGKYAIDSNNKTGVPEKNILTWLGTLMEKYLTMHPDQFMSYMRSFPAAAEETSDSRKDAFRYAKSNSFLLRSQLDCQDDRLPGTGVFDIKTRACLPVRLDILNFEEHSGYLIRTQHGLQESFEKEYYDLIRSAFLKYSFQARIGNMDGVFVAYHNTARMFGFQYIALEEMEERLYGRGVNVGEKVFEKCIALLEIISQEVIQCFPGMSVRCTFETKEGDNKLDIWVEPKDWNGKEKRPIIQLEVRITNYIGASEVKGREAVAAFKRGDAKWSLHWMVCRLSDTENNMRAALRDAQGRQFRAFFFPTGVDASEMPEFWAGLNFGGEKTETQIAYRGDHFRQASGNIRQLREMSRAGKKELNRIARQEAGKPKIVFGQSEPWIAPTAASPGKGTGSGVPVHSGYDFSNEASLADMEQE